MSEPSWMIYGANGFMGQKLTEHACQTGLRPVVSGRDTSRLCELGARLNLNASAFPLTSEEVETWIKGQKILVNCASPFADTSNRLRNACLNQKIHYLDLSPELLSIQNCIHQGDQWGENQLTLIPGLCPESLISEALAWKLKTRIPDLSSFSLEGYPSSQTLPTKGSLASMFEALRAGTWSRRSGKMIASRFPGTLRCSAHREDTLLMRTPGAELSTLWQSMGIPDIDSWRLAPFSTTWGINSIGKLLPLLKLQTARNWAIQKIIDFSEQEDRSQHESGDFWFGEGAGHDGELHWITLKTKNLSDLTARICVNLINNMLNNEFPGGVRTAGQILGAQAIFELVSKNSEVIMGGQSNGVNEEADHAQSDDKARE